MGQVFPASTIDFYDASMEIHPTVFSLLKKSPFVNVCMAMEIVEGRLWVTGREAGVSILIFQSVEKRKYFLLHSISHDDAFI